MSEAGDYARPLEMVRLAPAATNAQPWRVRKARDVYHFYAFYISRVFPKERN